MLTVLTRRWWQTEKQDESVQNPIGQSNRSRCSECAVPPESHYKITVKSGIGSSLKTIRRSGSVEIVSTCDLRDLNFWIAWLSLLWVKVSEESVKNTWTSVQILYDPSDCTTYIEASDCELIHKTFRIAVCGLQFREAVWSCWRFWIGLFQRTSGCKNILANKLVRHDLSSLNWREKKISPNIQFAKKSRSKHWLLEISKSKHSMKTLTFDRGIFFKIWSSTSERNSLLFALWMEVSSVEVFSSWLVIDSIRQFDLVHWIWSIESIESDQTLIY